MPVALPEVEWLEAHLAESQGSKGFANAKRLPLQAILHSLYYFPGESLGLPTTGDNIDHLRQVVFAWLGNKAGLADPQGRKDIDEILTMLLRYMLIQTKVVPAVYIFGTGDWANRDDFKGSYVLFFPSDPA